MSFLNSTLALGALAFTVPLVIHLLFRNRFRTVDWGAMQLIESAATDNHRQTQLRQLLLLLIRCAIPIVLALCLARPILTGMQSLPGDAPQSLVVAIDDSRSMSAIDTDGIQRFDRVKEAAQETLGMLSRRDEVILIRSSTVDSAPIVTGPQDAQRRISDWNVAGKPVDLARLLRAAMDAASEASHGQRRVVFFVDFQSVDLTDNVIESARRLAASQTDDIAASFFNVGMDSNLLENVLIESITVDAPAAVAGKSITVAARLRNFSDTARSNLQLEWFDDRELIDSTTISIGPRSAATTRISHTMDRADVHVVSIVVESDDAILADNRRSIGVDVIDEVDVVLVDGAPGTRPLTGASDFLRLALSPPIAAELGVTTIVNSRSIVADELVFELTESNPDVVVLAGVANPTDPFRAAVASFVSGGGSVVLFDGENIQIDKFNEPWESDRFSFRFPALLGPIVGQSGTADGEFAPIRLPVGEVNPLYSPWIEISGGGERFLDEVDVFRYRSLAINDPDESSRSLVSMANGDPLVVDARLGEGRLIQFAIPCNTAWSSLPLRTVFVPMMQQLMLDLAGSHKRTTIEAGTRFSVATSELLETSQQDQDTNSLLSADFTLETPDGTERLIQPSSENSDQLVVSQTATPGIYRIHATAQTIGGQPLASSTIRVVEVPASESTLRDADPARQNAIADSVGAKIHTDLDDLMSVEHERRYGREIWRPLLFVLLGAMFAELFLLQKPIRDESVMRPSR